MSQGRAQPVSRFSAQVQVHPRDWIEDEPIYELILTYQPEGCDAKMIFRVQGVAGEFIRSLCDLDIEGSSGDLHLDDDASDYSPGDLAINWNENRIVIGTPENYGGAGSRLHLPATAANLAALREALRQWRSSINPEETYVPYHCGATNCTGFYHYAKERCQKELLPYSGKHIPRLESDWTALSSSAQAELWSKAQRECQHAYGYSQKECTICDGFYAYYQEHKHLGLSQARQNWQGFRRNDEKALMTPYWTADQQQCPHKRQPGYHFQSSSSRDNDDSYSDNE